MLQMSHSHYFLLLQRITIQFNQVAVADQMLCVKLNTHKSAGLVYLFILTQWTVQAGLLAG